MKRQLKWFLKAVLYEIDQGVEYNSYRDLGITFANKEDAEILGALFPEDNPFADLIDPTRLVEIIDEIGKRIAIARPVRIGEDWRGAYPFRKVFLCWVAAVAVDLLTEYEAG